MNAIHTGLQTYFNRVREEADGRTFTVEPTVRGFAELLEDDERMNTVMTSITDGMAQHKGKYSCGDLSALYSFISTEPARLGRHCREVVTEAEQAIGEGVAVDLIAHNRMKAQITIGLKKLDGQLNQLASQMIANKFWNLYPSGSMPVLSAWMTPDGESVGAPTPRFIPKDSLNAGKGYFASVDDEAGSSKVPAGVLVIPQGQYRKDDTGANARQEFIINIGTIFACALAGSPDQNSGDDGSTRLRGRRDRKGDVFKMIQLAHPLLVSCAEMVDTLRAFSLLNGFDDDFEVYGYAAKTLVRTVISADENPLAIIEIGSFS